MVPAFSAAKPGFAFFQDAGACEISAGRAGYPRLAVHLIPLITAIAILARRRDFLKARLAEADAVR